MKFFSLASIAEAKSARHVTANNTPSYQNVRLCLKAYFKHSEHFAPTGIFIKNQNVLQSLFLLKEIV